MKIWIAAYINPSAPGGVLRSTTTIARELRKRGHRVRELYANKFYGNCILFSLGVMIKLIFTLDRPVWLIARSTDGFFPILAAKTFGFKTHVALHNHGWEERVYEQEKRLPAHCINNPTTWRARAIRFPMLHLTLRLADCCLNGTVDELRWLRRRRPVTTPLRYVPNGVDCISPLEPPAQNMALRFLAVGGQTWKKRIDYAVDLIEAVRSHLPDSRLTLLGADMSRPEKWIQSVAFVKLTHIAPLYRTHGCLVMPSRYEGGHPFTILEAMSYGCIVFASAIPPHREIIRHSINGYCISGTDVEADARLISDAISDSTRNRIRHNAISTAWRNRWERQIDRLERALDL